MTSVSWSSSNQLDEPEPYNIPNCQEDDLMSTESEDRELGSALSQLGENLKQLGQTAWESPERKKLQADLAKALKDVEGSLQQAGKDFRESETGQRLRGDIDRIKDEFESSEFERKARSELAALVHQLNQKLEAWLQSVGQEPDLEDSSEEEA
jgi:hypothetical protein